jgi:hypothetical protein
MNTIEYGEHCYGSYVTVDGEDLHQHEYDERGEEYIKQLKLKLVNELPKIVDRLSTYDLKIIAEIITQNNSDWEYDEENSGTNTCDQCGNYNYNQIYERSVSPQNK